MAALHGNPRRAMEDVVAARLRRIRARALGLLPGALALFGIQILGLLRPARPSLATLPHVALLSSAMWTAGSLLLLGILLTRRAAMPVSESAKPLIQALAWILTVAFGALLVGVASDVFAALDIITGSWALAAATAAALMTLAVWICW